MSKPHFSSVSLFLGLLVIGVFGMTLCIPHVGGAQRPTLARAQNGGAVVDPAPIRLAITIDDLPWVGPFPQGDSTADQVIERMAAVLRVHQAPATGFVVCERARENSEPLETWAAWGFSLGNHSESHRDLNRTAVDEWLADVSRCNDYLERYGDAYTPYFRFPMLHQGNSREKRDRVQSELQEMGLHIAHVTVDNSEWILTQAHAAALSAENAPLRRAVGREYIRHITAAVEHADHVARRKVGRSVPQILLLHANSVTEDYLDALLVALQNQGVQFISLTEALTDPIYTRPDAYIGDKGLSWLYRMTPPSTNDVQWDEAEANTIRHTFSDALSGNVGDTSGTPVSVQHVTPAAPDGIDAILEEAGMSERMRSLLIMHCGTLVAEGYFNGAGPETPANLKSVTKSLSSALVGIALREGWIDSVDDPIGPYLPERIDAESATASLTIRQLLTMSTGLQAVAYGTIQQREDWVGTLLSQPVRDETQGTFAYDTPVLQLLTAVLRNAGGMSAREVAQRELLDPLDGDLVHWRTDGQGIALGGNDAYLRPRTLIKIGELYRNGGAIDARTLLPPTFVEASTSVQIMPGMDHINHGTLPVRGYGYHWWLLDIDEEAMYAALGHGGQILLVAPQHDLVVLMTSRWPSTSSTAHYQHLTRILIDRVLPLFPPTP